MDSSQKKKFKYLIPEEKFNILSHKGNENKNTP
jgi:hypothetical protein